MTKIKEVVSEDAMFIDRFIGECQMTGDLRNLDGLTEDRPLIAAVGHEAGFPIDRFLSAVASTLRAENVRLGGAVQQDPAQSDSAVGGTCCADMVLVDLASGARVIISQDLGAEAQACRLDTGSLAEMGRRLEDAIDESIDLVILNKFGKAEAEGGGFRSVIARAMEIGVPLLTAVAQPHREPWQNFHGGFAVELAPTADEVLAWCRRAAEFSRTARSRQPIKRSA
ncbi:MAG: DUF2478 domain-containing protein [Bradyrhizobiaceae bacterium]|nr:DUF2478 domain-containing protein [Bradyrhizobiaceae bacterium]